jgi:tRNA-uridine 2-sulfurtransferase
VIVGPREALGARSVQVGALNWIGGGAVSAAREGIRVVAKLRSTQDPAPGVLSWDGAGDAQLMLDDPQFGISPGQAAVFYAADGDRVLGGGWILRTDAATAAA